MHDAVQVSQDDVDAGEVMNYINADATCPIGGVTAGVDENVAIERESSVSIGAFNASSSTYECLRYNSPVLQP